MKVLLILTLMFGTLNSFAENVFGEEFQALLDMQKPAIELDVARLQILRSKLALEEIGLADSFIIDVERNLNNSIKWMVPFL